MADGAHTRQMALQDMVQQLKEMNAQQAELKGEIGDMFSEMKADLLGILKQALKLPEQTTVTNPNPSVETVTNPEPLVETLKNSGPFIEPLKRASVLQVPDSFCDVLLVHKLDSHVKEVEELSHESTNGNDKIVAHQLFDQMPNEYQKDLAVISNKEVLSFSHKDDRVWEPGGVPNKMDLWDWPKGESKPLKKKSHQIEMFEVLSSLEPSQFDVTTIADAVWIAKHCESSLLQHSSVTQNRAPFSPYQNYNDQPYYEREFAKCPKIEFDRESDEIKDEKLQDKQPEEDVKTLECVGDEPSDDEKPSEVTVEESIDKSVDMIQEDTSTPENESSLEVSPQILLSQLRIFDDESQGTFGDHTLAPMKLYQSYSQSWYELDTIHSDINFTVVVAHECDVVSAVVVIYEVATTFEKLAKTWKFKFKSNPERSKLLDDMFSFMEKLSEKYVMVWESQQGNGLSLLNCLIDHDVLRPWICLGLYNSSLEAKLELSGWNYKKQINQGQICLNGLCNELVCDKEKKRESIEFNECHNHRKKLQAALEGIPQKIAGGLVYGDVKFHLKHKWRSRLEFCVDNAILFTSSVKLLFPKNHKLLHYEAEVCDLKQLSTEFQSFPGLNYFAYLIFLWNQTLNCGCEAGRISSGSFSVGDVNGFFIYYKLQNGDKIHGKRLLILNEISLLENNNKVDFTIEENWFYTKPMTREVFHLQRPPEPINLQGNPNFITKVLVQWKEHPPDQFFSGFDRQVS